MQKIVRWIGVALGVLAGLLFAGAGAIYALTEARLNRVYTIPPEPIAIPAQVDSTRRDWPYTLVAFCKECHGPDLGGQVLETDPLMGTFASSNLTSGQGGIAGAYTDQDWIRALRHGVRPDGRPLVGMPSNIFNRLSDGDLAVVIALVRAQPAVDRELPKTSIGPLVRLMLVTGSIGPDALPAEVIDHAGARPDAPAPGVTIAYGRYMAILCATCHGDDMSGGPDAGQGMNLTPGGAMKDWTEKAFIQTLMPWNDIQNLSDEQLRAIWLYLRSLPPVQTEHR